MSHDDKDGDALLMKIAHIVMGFENEDSAEHYNMLRDIRDAIASASPSATAPRLQWSLDELEAFDRASTPSSSIAPMSDLKTLDGRPLLQELSNIVLFLDSEGANASARVVEGVAKFLSTLSGKYDRFDAAKAPGESTVDYTLRLLGRLAHLERQLAALESTPRSATRLTFHGSGEDLATDVHALLSPIERERFMTKWQERERA